MEYSSGNNIIFQSGSETDTVKPQIDGVWQATYSPTQPAPGGYMNDHTIIKAGDGNWHLIGISGGGSGYEKSFAHGSSSSLDGPWTEHPPLAAYADENGNPLDAWAPHAIVKDGVTYLFYRSNLNDGSSTLALDTSTDPQLLEWERRLDVSLTVPADENHFRDVMVIPDGDIYRMYYCAGWHDRSSVGMATSSDLINWTHQGSVLTTSAEATDVSWGAAESPFVFRQGEFWYLSTTLTTSAQSDYHQTLIFRSADPGWFGDYNGDKTATPGANFVTELPVHAPEYFQDGAQWYITTCGWENMSLYPEAQHGVAIAPLRFDTFNKGVPADGLVAWYAFNQMSGNDVLSDTGTNNALLTGRAAFVGEHAGTPALTVSASRPGAVQLPPLTFSDDFTFAAWVNLNASVSNSQGLFKLGADSDINLYHGQTRFHANGSDLAVSSVTMTTNQWNHIAVTRQSGTIQIYINGALTATSATTYTSAVSPENLGQTLAGQSSATYDNLALYQRALNIDEITLVMNRL